MKLTFKALALVAAMISAPAFAANGTDYVTDLTGTVDVVGTEAPAAMALYTLSGGAVGDSYTGNVALIEQLGSDSNIAVIDQSASAGPGNFAAISQSSTNPANVAYISQLGTNGFAFIKQ